MIRKCPINTAANSTDLTIYTDEMLWAGSPQDWTMLWVLWYSHRETVHKVGRMQARKQVEASFQVTSCSVKTEIQVWSRERQVKSCQSLAKVERQSYSSHSITFQTLACTVTAFQSSNSQVTVREHSQHYHGLAIGNVTQMLVQLDNQELRCPQYN
jgi:hypothetical protein